MGIVGRAGTAGAGEASTPAGRARRGGLALRAGAAIAVPGIALAGWLFVRGGEEEVPVTATGGVTGGVGVVEISATELEQVARARVFFGHQSVGMNILDGVPEVFADHGVAAPPIEQRRSAAEPAGSFIAETLIGENTDPLGKVRDFEAVIRGGMGEQVDVALMKFCYVDVTPGTDVDALFAAYRDTMTALQKDFPDVTFVMATVPLTTQPDLLHRVKQRVAGNDGYGAAANAARERLNELIRAEYGGDHLFDLAAVESTAPDGSRVAGRSAGRAYFALYPGYAADPGHLNAEGSRRAATAWLAAVARAAR